jgi:hypothetical protein
MKCGRTAGFVAMASALAASIGWMGCGGSGNRSPDGGGEDVQSRHEAGASDSGTSGDAGSNGDVGNTKDAADGTVIFSQPSLPGATGNFFAPLCSSGIGAGLKAAPDHFGITSWQCPLDAGFVTDTSSAVSLTGFDPNTGNDLGAFQVGYSSAPNISVAQIDGNQVGVYMDSTDLSGYSVCPSPSNPALPNQGCKMGMFPQVTFTVGRYMPFSTGTTVVVSFQKMVATAETYAGSEAYVVSDLLFVDTSGTIDMWLSFRFGGRTSVGA